MLTASLRSILFDSEQERVKDVSERLYLIYSGSVFLNPGRPLHHKSFVVLPIRLYVFMCGVLHRS